MDNPSGTGKIVHASDAYFCCHELKENGKLDMEKTMSSLNKIRILENDEQKKTNPNSNEAFELGFVDSLRPSNWKVAFYCFPEKYSAVSEV
ncbi:hypothetical protein GCM10010978_08410 [Compostibacillus humi]|uniref:Uncharacterized protein n=1 Tax=Compostibacillus humi TaxID=1245525 RepID=A0A8J2ZR63_9BACI|nr:hypothetical protein GCM10010978_08410 [Compostibacillus humi]